ncbi:MAG: family 20 glycosylhydrolase, partial [Clostridia bacterium]|nr:family 20 glycosylhydrolase [Clostridia bacterium]
IAPVMAKHVSGVEVPIWTEYICDFDKLCYMFFPRFAAVAEIGWSKKEKCNYISFERRFRNIVPLLNEIDIHPAPQQTWNPTTIERLTGTLNFFKDKISLKALSNSLGSQKN